VEGWEKAVKKIQLNPFKPKERGAEKSFQGKGLAREGPMGKKNMGKVSGREGDISPGCNKIVDWLENMK